MKLQIKFIIFGLLLLVFFGSAIFFYQRYQETSLFKLFNSTAEERIFSFDRILEIKGETLKSLAFDYTFWDEMVDFVKTKDRDWAEQNIKEGIKSFGVDTAWVYTEEFDCIYSTCNPQGGQCGCLPLEKKP
ncbi:MAG: hypothetical protein NC818_03815 [Candidatus Omnitrophica bacterium]|nr:hypothetical protein [Candidatus Omnitrophota bacterium]